jgi:hypothetical protein
MPQDAPPNGDAGDEVALAALDEHAHGPWLDGGTMSTSSRHARRRAKGLPNWRIRACLVDH